MDIALCYESVLPARGGAETYIGDLARRLSRDGHAVHLYAARWDPSALPASTHFHRIDVPSGRHPHDLHRRHRVVSIERLQHVRHDAEDAGRHA